MRKRALWKDFYMEIKMSLNRFLSIFLIVSLGVAFFAGIRATNPDMRLTADSYFDNSNLMDLRILSAMGLTDEDVKEISDIPGIELVEPTYSADVLYDIGGSELVLKVNALTKKINKYTLKEGRFPEKNDEVLVDSYFISNTKYKLGDRIKISSGTDEALSNTLKNDKFTIVGIASNPYYLSSQRGTTSIGNGKINSFIVVLPEVFNMKVYTTIYASVSGAKELTTYTDKYNDKVKTVVNRLKSIKSEQAQRNIKSKWYILDRNSIEAYVEYEQNADRIGAIGNVFPAIFFLIAALISLTTMTRMVEEERTQIGVLKALGYTKKSIAMKYLLYAFLATIGGSLFGAAVGLKVLPTVIITAYKSLYANIPEIIAPFNMYYFVMATFLSVFCVELATLLACYKELLSKPANLMRPEAPKIGKRVVLERIPLFWNHLGFTWKATARNLFRYKKRFIMTIIGIGGCMSLLLVGFGLKDSIYVIYTRQYDEIMMYNASVAIDTKASLGQKKELEQELDKLSEIKSWMRMRNESLDISSNGITKSVSLYIPEHPSKIKNYITLRNRVGHKEYTLGNNGVVLTEQIANKLNLKVGDVITLKKGGKEGKVKISGITENYMAHYLYMTPQLYQSIFNTEINYNEYVLLMPNMEEKQQLNVGNHILQYKAATGVFYTSYNQNMLTNVMASLNIVIWILIISAGALAFVVLYNLNNININERRRELATIKVLGFYNNEMAAYIYRENIVLTFIGALFGILIGILLHHYVIITAEIDMLMFGRNIYMSSYVYSFLLTILFSILVNLVMYYKLRKIDMVESLKSVE